MIDAWWAALRDIFGSAGLGLRKASDSGPMRNDRQTEPTRTVIGLESRIRVTSESVHRRVRPRARVARSARRRATKVTDAGLRAFYAADSRRGASPERDLGSFWRSVHGTTYRAAWIADTEELYSVRCSGDTDRAEVTVLARLTPEAVERALAGWRRICNSGVPGSYEWLVERAAGAWREAASGF
jgi:hypothetical protein